MENEFIPQMKNWIKTLQNKQFKIYSQNGQG